MRHHKIHFFLSPTKMAQSVQKTIIFLTFFEFFNTRGETKPFHCPNNFKEYLNQPSPFTNLVLRDPFPSLENNQNIPKNNTVISLLKDIGEMAILRQKPTLIPALECQKFKN